MRSSINYYSIPVWKFLHYSRAYSANSRRAVSAFSGWASDFLFFMESVFSVECSSNYNSGPISPSHILSRVNSIDLWRINHLAQRRILISIHFSIMPNKYRSGTAIKLSDGLVNAKLTVQCNHYPRPHLFIYFFYFS